MTTLTASPLTDALAAVERALAEYGVTIVRHSISSAIHRADYLAGPDAIAALSWGDGLMFFENDLAPEQAALVESHALLLTASPV